ncbi:MAG: SpoIIE family protein phosphatase [Acidobacteria bacterium Pan2503]|uniref:SpoIIE family protein phosphatase n=1 Tax=Candidatus Acidiferrum panamense TaxID=2741543 RepID=A0A7V8T0C8_9BACT|nr:SpoIIE family protein phosphatase [Candidatus Acidoferrum panamensis]
MKSFFSNLKEGYSRLSWQDLVCSAIVALGLLVALLGINGKVSSFLEFLAVVAGVYLAARFIGWWRSRLLWSLRNRLVVVYLFIAVVPILSIVVLVVLAARILYSQLGAYLLYEDIHQRIEMIADIAQHIAIAHKALPSSITEDESERILAAQSAVHDRELPKLKIDFSSDPSLLSKVAGQGQNSFAGLLQEEDSDPPLSLISLRRMEDSNAPRVVVLRVPVTAEFLSTIAPDLGVIQLNLMENYKGAGVLYTSGEKRYRVVPGIVASNRTLQAAMFWFDSPVSVVSPLDSFFVAKDGTVDPARPLLAVSNARPSRLNARIFTSLGELRGTYVILFVLVGIVFLLIEAVAWTTGIVLTRRITRAVADLYQATQFVKAGDFSHRVQMKQRDQLGELGESFNKMTSSISELIEEEAKRRRLENEISIAREVQNQLFPSTLPSVPGVEIEAICRAARSVSGDYYDFIQLSPTHVAIAIADISGKGISAALLMASLQAALRSQALTEGSEYMSTAELVTRLNKHLVRNTGDDRFATFFIAVYDSATRTLRYTNAGHLPSFLICNGSSHLLDKGGMVLGVLEDYVYEQGELQVAPESLLIGYSDGLVEPENVYGEEFGIARLREAAIRVQSAEPSLVAESLMAAAEEWAGTPEQADDMTVIVTRLR